MSKKTILEICLYAQYYKKDITDRYYINNKSFIITEEAIDILDKPQEKLYIDTWDKKIKKDKEIERLNKELEGKNKVIDAMIDNEEEMFYITPLSKINKNKK